MIHKNDLIFLVFFANRGWKKLWICREKNDLKRYLIKINKDEIEA